MKAWDLVNLIQSDGQVEADERGEKVFFVFENYFPRFLLIGDEEEKWQAAVAVFINLKENTVRASLLWEVDLQVHSTDIELGLTPKNSIVKCFDNFCRDCTMDHLNFVLGLTVENSLATINSNHLSQPVQIELN